MSTKMKVALTVAVLAGGVGYMVYTTVSSGTALEYFKHVQELAAEPGKWQGERVQLHGNIVAGSILKRPGSMDYKFALHREGRWLEVSYSGIVPDSFRDCAELVVKGKLVDPRHFAGDEISAKCPSKYDGKRQTGCGADLTPQVLAARK